MPQATYVVDRRDGEWVVLMGERRFGPYSSQETATAAAIGAARKAEAQGFEAAVVIRDGEPEAAAAEDGRDAA